jgi:hypothetical protein
MNDCTPPLHREQERDRAARATTDDTLIQELVQETQEIVEDDNYTDEIPAAAEQL